MLSPIVPHIAEELWRRSVFAEHPVGTLAELAEDASNATRL